MNQGFIKGLKLSQLLYEEGVRPVLAGYFPDLSYSAARLGGGSDVLGFDTPQSMDHDWGPRLMLFLTEADYEGRREAIDGTLRQALPAEVHGYSTHFGTHADGTMRMEPAGGELINHGVTFHTVGAYFQSRLNVDVGEELRAVDWLAAPEQVLLSMTAGRVFHDGLGQLERVRAKLRYYPDDVWFYLLAAQWRRLSQEEAFMGRCSQVGDELGSRLVAGRLVRDLMRLCFLMERQYAPYIKWFGTAFKQLKCADRLMPIFTQVLDAGSGPEREKALVLAYETVAEMHNGLGITEPLPTHVSLFHERPFMVIHGDRFAEVIRAAITSEEVRALPENLGSVDQFVDSTDVLSHAEWLVRLKLMYE